MWIISRFKELGEYKNKIIMNLIDDEELVQCLFYNCEDFLNKPKVQSPVELIYTRIFPYKNNPNISNVQSTFITMAFGGYKQINTYYKAGHITFFVFTHSSLMRTDYGVLRTDFILNRIDELFNKSSLFGIGKLQFDTMDDLYVNNDYSGSWIRYKVMDFN